MKLRVFIQVLYNFVADRYENQEDYFKDLINSSVDDDFDDFIDNTQKSTISRYLNGHRSLKTIARKVISNLDKDKLSGYFDTIFRNDDKIILFKDTLNKNGAKIEDFNDINDIVDYYYELLSIEANAEIKKKNIETKKNDKSVITLDDLSPNKLKNYLKKENDRLEMLDLGLNQDIPENIREDFKYKISRNNKTLAPELVPTNVNAFKKHRLKYLYTFANSKEIDLFFRNIQKASLMNEWIPVNNYVDVERYIDDYKDKYYDSKRYKTFVGPIQKKLPSLKMKVILDNGLYSIKQDNLILKIVERKDGNLILNNNDDNNWLFITLTINCNNYGSGTLPINMNIGIKKEYLTNVKYVIELYKVQILMNDNKTYIRLTDMNKNNDFINGNCTNKNDLTEDDYKDFNYTIDLLNKLNEIQELYNVTFKYNEEEFMQHRPTYEVAYACIKGEKCIINKEIDVDVVVLNDNINEYIIGDKKDRSNATDYLILFDKVIAFPIRTITLKDSETIKLYKEDGINHAIVKTKNIEIK